MAYICVEKVPPLREGSFGQCVAASLTKLVNQATKSNKAGSTRRPKSWRSCNPQEQQARDTFSWKVRHGYPRSTILSGSRTSSDQRSSIVKAVTCWRVMRKHSQNQVIDHISILRSHAQIILAMLCSQKCPFSNAIPSSKASDSRMLSSGSSP